MKTRMASLVVLALVGIVVLGLSSCSSTSEKSEKPGRVMAMTKTSTATVEAIDAANRMVTLRATDGTLNIYKLGPEVRNFDQIEVGDQVKTTVVESLAIFVRNPGEPANDGERSVVALAPRGAKPGVVMAETSEITAKVESVDADARTVTVRGPEGKIRTFAVAPDINLAAVKKGDDVVVRYTQAIAITVETP